MRRGSWDSIVALHRFRPVVGRYSLPDGCVEHDRGEECQRNRNGMAARRRTLIASLASGEVLVLHLPGVVERVERRVPDEERQRP